MKFKTFIDYSAFNIIPKISLLLPFWYAFLCERKSGLRIAHRNVLCVWHPSFTWVRLLTEISDWRNERKSRSETVYPPGKQYREPSLGYKNWKRVWCDLKTTDGILGGWGGIPRRRRVKQTSKLTLQSEWLKGWCCYEKKWLSLEKWSDMDTRRFLGYAENCISLHYPCIQCWVPV